MARLRPRESDAPEIVIDDRERAGGLINALAESLGPTVRVERLAVGDVLVANRYLIERKSAPDFVASILDGRLFNQAKALRDQNYDPIIILEGDFEPTNGGVSPEALRGSILSLALDWKIPVLRSKSIDDTTYWIQALLKRNASGRAPPSWRGISPSGQRIVTRHNRPRRAPLSPAEAKKRREMNLLLEIEGVGKTRAEALLKRFGDFSGVGKASVFDLTDVDGLGRAVAERIWRTFNGDDEPPR